MRAAGQPLIFALAALLLAGCASFDAAAYRTFAIARSPSVATWHGMPIETGQLIVMEPTSATSLFLSLLTRDYQPYLHIGLIVLEGDEPYVYEAMGAIMLLPWDRPNAHVGGGVQRVKLASFLQRRGITAIYDPPAGIDRRVLAEFARARWRERFPFDGQYDARDPSKYYCVEFVARALEAAGAAPVRATPITDNASVHVALDWLHMRTPELLMAGAVVERERRVVLLARGLSEPEVERYFLLKRELHRRFTPDQRLGSVMLWRHQRLQLRPRVDEYFEAGVHGQADPAILADRMFGSLQPASAANRPEK